MLRPIQRSALWLAGMPAVLALLSATTACNTLRGAGQDVEAAGETLEEGARDIQN